MENGYVLVMLEWDNMFWLDSNLSYDLIIIDV